MFWQRAERKRQRSRLRWRRKGGLSRWDTQERVSFWINKANTGSNVSLTARGNCASNCLNIKRRCTRPMAFPFVNVCVSAGIASYSTWIVFHVHRRNTLIREMDFWIAFSDFSSFSRRVHLKITVENIMENFYDTKRSFKKVLGFSLSRSSRIKENGPTIN